ncbi:endonuclease domain-containing protein [Cellulosimicrobium sp. Marseille-Q4280]|uniref:endonuclease domain-containing protein n=1 Tax=Cellulosimicrobium sp. Marseille-Q4280 TaxID=2937992 RepID=UPI00203B1A57|nr:endonuclease domain-containing protein [Cellulosimicrobium sp. Marseille-Q4280]
MRTPTAVPAELLVVAEAQEGLLSASQCDEHGVGSHRRARLVEKGRWCRVTHAVFDTVVTPVPRRTGTGAHDHRRRRAAWLGLLAYGRDAIAVGPCALVLLGVEGVRVDPVPEATLPGARAARSRDGMHLRQFDDGMTVTNVEGRWVATPDWALAQAVPEMGRRRAVAAMDSARRLGLVSAAGLERAHDLARGRRGVARTHSWWAESDARAESPLETFARLDCTDAGIAPDELQVEVYDEGRLLGRGDVGWRLPGGRWLIAELDGRDVHSEPAALLRDRTRQNDLVGSGAVDLLRFTGRDVTPPGASRPGRLVADVRRHLRRARHHSPSSTTWRTE